MYYRSDFTTTGQKSWQFSIILWLHLFILKSTDLYDPWVLRKNPGAVFRCFAQQFLTDCSVVRQFSIAFHEHLFEHPLSSHQDQLRHSTHLNKHWKIDNVVIKKSICISIFCAGVFTIYICIWKKVNFCSMNII